MRELLHARCRRERVQLRPALLRAALHLVPWLIVVAIVYLANLVGLLPQSPGAVIPPGSPVVDEPRYLRVVRFFARIQYSQQTPSEQRVQPTCSATLEEIDLEL